MMVYLLKIFSFLIKKKEKEQKEGKGR